MLFSPYDDTIVSALLNGNLGQLLWTGTRMNKLYVYTNILVHLLHTSRMKDENISCSISHRKFANWMIDAETVTFRLNILYKCQKIVPGDLYIRSYSNQSGRCWCAKYTRQPTAAATAALQNVQKLTRSVREMYEWKWLWLDAFFIYIIHISKFILASINVKITSIFKYNSYWQILIKMHALERSRHFFTLVCVRCEHLIIFMFHPRLPSHLFFAYCLHSSQY